MVSSLTGDGLDGLWELMLEFKTTMDQSGELQRKRQAQREIQMWSQIENQLLGQFKRNAHVQRHLGDIRSALRQHQITPGLFNYSFNQI